jgi:anti-sigma regulatory factor (Ser/Thr protein kinase)
MTTGQGATVTHDATDNAFAEPAAGPPTPTTASALRKGAVPNASGSGTWRSLMPIDAKQWAMATRSTDGLRLADRSYAPMHADRAILNGVEVPVARATRPGAEMSAEDLRRPGQLRRIGLAHLQFWKLGCLADNAALLISELVTNALCHGHGAEFALRMIHTAGEVRIEVYDGSQCRPYERAAGPEDESGRGMSIVAAIADSWGISKDGTRTWCTLDVPTAGTGQ